MSNLRVVVAGNRGFIGSAVTKALRDAGKIEILGIDRNERAGRDPNVDSQLFGMIGVDLRDDLEGYRPHVIINMAGEPGVGFCQASPEASWRDNVYVTETLLDVARYYNTPRFVHASSAAVYGHDSRSVYARDKMLAEHRINNDQDIFQKVCLRFFNVYGPGADHGVISAWSRAIVRGETPRIDAPFDTSRDFIHVDDVAMAVMLAATVPWGEDVNFAMDICTGLETRLDRLAKLMGIDLEDMAHAPHDPSTVLDSVGCPVRARKFLGFNHRRTLSEEIPSTIAAERNNL